MKETWIYLHIDVMRQTDWRFVWWREHIYPSRVKQFKYTGVDTGINGRTIFNPEYWAVLTK